MNQNTNWKPSFYSEFGEDYLLSTLFKAQPSGFFVDIGVFDGRHSSPSLHFEELGWAGVCVEPHPTYFPILEKARPGSRCVQAAIVGEKRPDAVASQAGESGLSSVVSPHHEIDMDRRSKARGQDVKGLQEIQVPALTLTDLFEKYVPKDTDIDFLSLDTAGTEEDILRNVKLRIWRPQAIVVTANDQAAQASISRLLRASGYILSRQAGRKLIFATQQDDAALMKYQRINCEVAGAPHPLDERPAPKTRRIADRNRVLSRNVLCQQPDQPFSTMFDYFPAEKKRNGPIRLVHAINLFSVDGGLDQVQTATVNSMQHASRARSPTGGETVLLQIQSDGDPDLTPDGFRRGRDLQRDIRDIEAFKCARSLPLLFDVLDRAAEDANPEDFIIYTNADICLQPHFYDVIHNLLSSGFDAITVNRRTIGENLISMPPSVARAETGLIHRGYDCFVFSKRAYDKYVKNDACLGIAGVMRSLMYNMVAFSDTMLMLKNVSLTYHFGNDRSWSGSRFADITQHNRAEFLSVLGELSKMEPQRTLLEDFCRNHPEPKPAQALFEHSGRCGQDRERPA